MQSGPVTDQRPTRRSSRTARPVRAALTLCVLAGCGPARDPDPPPGDVELVVGSAPETGMGFEAMPGAATLRPGAQGGFHVWVSYRVKGGSGPFNAGHTVRRAADGKLLSRGERRLELGAAGDDGWRQSEAATPAFLCPTPLGLNAIDVDAVFEVTLFDERAAAVAKQQVTTKLECPSGDQADFCRQICKG